MDAQNAWLSEQIPKLLAYDFELAAKWYAKMMLHIIARPQNMAFLACNDRYFLLTCMLGRRDAVHPWLYYRCREVEIDPDEHLDLWARDHYKSTIITFAGTIQEIIRDPEITIAIFSHTKGISQKFLSQVMRELENNERLHMAFQDVFYEDPRKQAPMWSLQNGLIVKRQSNPKESTLEAHGLVDGQPTSKHFALRIYDDVVTRESVTTPEMIKKTTEAWELSDNLGASGSARRWHIGTRYSFGDTWGIILERGALTPRIYAATENGKLDGKPVFLSQKRWDDKKNTQRSTVSAQMLQNPIAGNENTFRPEWFRPFEIRPSVLNVYIMGDPSKGSSAKSDRTAIAVVGIDVHGNKYLLDGVRHRMPMSERWRTLKMLHQKWTKEPGVETVAVGWERYGQQTDDEYFQERMREENYSFHIAELAWPREGDHSKKARVERLEPDFRNGRFFLPALVSDALGDALWSIDLDKSHILTKPVMHGKLPRIMEQYRAGGKAHMIAKSIRRIDEDRKPYDLTRALIEEMMFFPFAPKDDLVDAVSRIYDMESVPPSYREQALAEHLNAIAYEDS